MTLAIMKRFGSKPSHDRTSAGPGAKEAVVEGCKGTRVLSRSPHLGRLKIVSVCWDTLRVLMIEYVYSTVQPSAVFELLY